MKIDFEISQTIAYVLIGIVSSLTAYLLYLFAKWAFSQAKKADQLSNEEVLKSSWLVVKSNRRGKTFYMYSNLRGRKLRQKISSDKFLMYRNIGLEVRGPQAKTYNPERVTEI